MPSTETSTHHQSPQSSTVSDIKLSYVILFEDAIIGISTIGVDGSWDFAQVSTSQRKRPREDEDLDDAGVSKKFFEGPMITSSPSTVASYELVKELQANRGYRIANDRPAMDVGAPPIALLYHGFGRFFDCMSSDSTDPTDGVDTHRLEKAVDTFSAAMCKYYHDEFDRRDVALPLLDDIFNSHSESHKLTPLAAAMVYQERRSDGHAFGPLGAIEMIVEVKNELCASDSDPEILLAAHYTQSLMKEARKHTPYSVFPALGSSVGFYALALVDRTKLVALTPLYCLSTDLEDYWTRPALLKAFRSACILRFHIHNDNQQFMTISNPLPLQRYLPYVREVAAWPADTTGKVLSITLRESAHQGATMQYPNRFIYVGTAKGVPGKVLVKFTHSYFVQLHDFCAARGHAPKLLGYGVDLKKLANDFHAHGWVHGDLRAANLIVRKTKPEQVQLIDFGWAGDLNAGQVHYPTTLLNEELTDGEDPNDLLITKERDDRVLANTLNDLGEVGAAAPVTNDGPVVRHTHAKKVERSYFKTVIGQ
ncbi:uncharacterized protein LAESUDRAFT_710451 [Laetiporus sulphureus 93-53]|uniref:Protein kinase domain-containing protein n=1 Tax=Laetiporus sulphureus 93-53 TaxID=1314785 RepID=A0A165HM61_9APHY|nr:uncharacterized protein LAESUDRAFT_710451 [Laetiporus sulphureus 93-53]KZT11916.1 hypothetical protein LAESUDRAFT_710451 [Laetiporus sulphureus 93-53]